MQCLKNLSAVLEEAGSSLQNCVKVNVFLTDMTNFAAMNTVYESFFDDPKPASVGVSFSGSSSSSSSSSMSALYLCRSGGQVDICK